MLYMPIVVLFFQDNGLGMQDIMLLKGIYSIAIVLFEIPSGYFADVLGRKMTMILGAVLGAVGFVIYAFSGGFFGFLLAELTLGIGQSFISGADSALLYDSLKAEGREGEYVKEEGRVMSLGNFAETGAAILGGILAEVSLRTPFVAQIFIAALAIPATLTLVDPTQGQGRKGSLKDVLAIIRKALWEDKKLRMAILLSSIIGASTVTYAWFVQPYLALLQFSPWEIGVIWSLLNLSVAVVTLFAYKIVERLGKPQTLGVIVAFISLGYIVTGSINSVYTLIFVFTFYMVRGIATPVLKDYINQYTESNVRATVLSMRSFIIRFAFALFSPFLGWYADVFSLRQALLLAGVVFLVLSSFIAIVVVINDRK